MPVCAVNVRNTSKFESEIAMTSQSATIATISRYPLLPIFAVCLLLAMSVRTTAQATNTFPTSGNTGVGTTSPGSILTIQTTGADSDGSKYVRIKNTSSFTGLLFDPNQSGDAGWLLLAGYPSAGDFTIREYGVANYFTIKKTSGNVGIGTTSPGTKLTVTNNSSANPGSGMTVSVVAADGVQDGVSVDTFGSAASFLLRRGNTSAASPSALSANDPIGVIAASGYGSSAYSTTRANIKFFASENWTNTAQGTFMAFSTTANGATTAGGTERMRIDNAGNLGLGTTTPSTKFHMFSSGTTDNVLQTFQNGTRNWSIGINGTSDFFRITDQTVGVARLTILNTGDIGIGTTAPGYKLDVQGGQLNTSGGLCINGDCKTAWSQVTGNVTSAFGRTGAITAATNDYTWAQINKSTSSLADLTTRSATDLTSGTLPDARFPATLPTASGANLTNLNATNLGSGTVSIARLGLSGTADSTTFLRGDNTWTAVTSSQWTAAGTNNINYAVSGGNVGIGVSGTPSAKLDVNGAAHVSGNMTVDGNIAAKYQDVAEWVPASERLSAGTVVVLDSNKSNQVTSSTTSYDTRVAGVVSEQPGIALGEKSEGKVLVATTGRVRVKVDASKGPIQIGDLLVTSDVPGVAMKSEPVNLGGVAIHRPGTLIGKALEPLEKGKGEILVLLSLQ